MNRYPYTSAIRVHLPAVKYLWFYDRILEACYKFDEKDIEELFKLNPQLENPVVHFGDYYNEYSSEFISHIKEYCPNLQPQYSVYSWVFNLFCYETFVLHHFSEPIYERDKNEIHPEDTSEEYMNALENLYELYSTFAFYYN